MKRVNFSTTIRKDLLMKLKRQALDEEKNYNDLLEEILEKYFIESDLLNL